MDKKAKARDILRFKLIKSAIRQFLGRKVGIWPFGLKREAFEVG